MTKPASISVVIPAYNAAKLLPLTLESVLEQTLLPLEILVIDDGSTDDTAEVAERFGSPVKVFRCPNQRQAAARNFGAKEAKGEWIAFLDSDDLWAPNKLALQMEQLAANPSADFCYAARIPFSGCGKPETFGTIVPVPPPMPDALRKALYRNTCFLPSAVLIRRATFLAAGGFDTSFKIVEDWDLWMRLLHSGVVFTGRPEPLLLYRVHAESVSNNARTLLQEADDIFRKHALSRIPRHQQAVRYARFRSEHEAAAALLLRTSRDPAYLRMMTASILRDPFHYPHRYKILAHMLYTTLRRQQGNRSGMTFSDPA